MLTIREREVLNPLHHFVNQGMTIQMDGQGCAARSGNNVGNLLIQILVSKSIRGTSRGSFTLSTLLLVIYFHHFHHQWSSLLSPIALSYTPQVEKDKYFKREKSDVHTDLHITIDQVSPIPR